MVNVMAAQMLRWVQHGSIIRTGYGVATQPPHQFFLVATSGIATKKSPADQKAFFPYTTIVKEAAVKLFTGHLLL